jgi:signal transduction histidine kinase
MTHDEIASVGAFRQFRRLYHAQQGLGLGLVIAQRLLDLYHGSLTIESVPGAQTTVRVRLPAPV